MPASRRRDENVVSKMPNPARHNIGGFLFGVLARAIACWFLVSTLLIDSHPAVVFAGTPEI